MSLINVKGLNGEPSSITYQGDGLPTILYIFSPRCLWCASNLENAKALASGTNGRYRFIALSLSDDDCGSENIVRNGLTANGKQRFLCRDCRRRSRENPRPNGYTDEEREEILRAYHERSILRGLTRTFGMARDTVSVLTNWAGGAPCNS